MLRDVYNQLVLMEDFNPLACVTGTQPKDQQRFAWHAFIDRGSELFTYQTLRPMWGNPWKPGAEL